MADSSDKGKTPELLAQHYQKTFELTHELWNERNRLFPVLALVIGVAMLLALRVPQADSLLVAIIASLLKLTDDARAALQSAFPFDIVQTVLMAIVFHLVLNLYRQTLYITRNYDYLGFMEKELREQIGLAKDTVSFTREGEFYNKYSPRLLHSVKWVYTVVLGILLAVFLYARISDDIQRGNLLFILVNIGIGIPIVIYYIGYVIETFSSPTKKTLA